MTHTGYCHGCGFVRPIHGRNLCPACYVRNKRNGTIERYSLVRPPVPRLYRWCECTKPLVDRLPLWSTAQCLACGHEIAPDVLAQLEE